MAFLLLIATKCILFLNIFDAVAHMMRLLYHTIKKLTSYLIFFLIWHLLLALMYILIGNSDGGHPDEGHDGDEY